MSKLSMMLSGGDDTISHKRVVCIASFIMLCGLALLSAFGYSATSEYAYIFGVLTGGESFLTVIEKVKHHASSLASSESEDGEA